MGRLTFHLRSLAFHRRTNLAVTLGAAVGAAALTGALVVGDSMRTSLRDAALGRLGRVDYALVSNRFFREALVSQVTSKQGDVDSFGTSAPVILLSGGAVHAETQARADRIAVLGVDNRFWPLRREGGAETPPELAGRSVVLNEPLARELGARPGDDILIRLGKPSAVSTETLLGRRNDITATLRLTVERVIPGEDLGAFSLRPGHAVPQNAYVPLSVLQRVLDRRHRVNAMLIASSNEAAATPEAATKLLRDRLAARATLADLGLTLRVDERLGYVALESESVLIAPAVEAAALTAAGALDVRVSPVLTYLANRISKGGGGDAAWIPYSTVSAIDPATPVMSSLAATGDAVKPALQPGEILLNRWAADDLEARPDDDVSLSYYVTGRFGRLETRRATFQLRAVVPLEGAAADPGFTPPYKGVTDTENLADWDAPFPMDLGAIRDRDEAYWDRYKATPKAFITLADGRRLWAEGEERFGRLTSIRLNALAGKTEQDTAEAFHDRFMKELDFKRLGLDFEPVRARMVQAGEGTTDFGGLFVGFSFFLIASAAMLVALLFRLGVERRSGEIGLLLSTGFSPRAVARLLVAEGAVLAAIGGVIGIGASLGYAWLMLAGLRSWWSDAVHAPFLRLHATPTSLVLGFVLSFFVATGSIAWSIRGLTKLSARSLLSGVVAAGRSAVSGRKRGHARGVAVTGFVLAVGLTILSALAQAVPKTATFFCAGAAMLIGCLAFVTDRLRAERGGLIHRSGLWTWARLGMRNARRHPGRSVLTAGLVASATFLIVALEAFRLGTDVDVTDRRSGTGGYALYAESAVPLLFDLNTSVGREAMGFGPEAQDALAGVALTPYRLRPGDGSSCTNLYRPLKPRILGASDAAIERGGFVFSATLAESQAERDNPWTLLNRTFDDGAIPVIGDESTVLWQLHLGLGKDLVMADETGREVRLRFVALLSGSVVQDELTVAESRFVELFPSIGGYGFFLIDAPADQIADATRVLERELDRFSFDVGSTADRLASYLAVQNTYISTFQTLGGFGLVLGTIGLAAVLLRNVWERRGELALLRALGFSHASLGWIVLAENVVLLIAGLASGVLSALLAIAPHVASRPATIPWLSVGATLAAVFLVGVGAGMAATMSSLRARLLPALRTE